MWSMQIWAIDHASTGTQNFLGKNSALERKLVWGKTWLITSSIFGHPIDLSAWYAGIIKVCMKCTVNDVEGGHRKGYFFLRQPWLAWEDICFGEAYTPWSHMGLPSFFHFLPFMYANTSPSLKLRLNLIFLTPKWHRIRFSRKNPCNMCSFLGFSSGRSMAIDVNPFAWRESLVGYKLP